MGRFSKSLGQPPHRPLQRFLDRHGEAFPWLPNFKELREEGTLINLNAAKMREIKANPPQWDHIPDLTTPVCVTDPQGSVLVYPIQTEFPFFRVFVFSTPEVDEGEIGFVIEALVRPVESRPGARAFDICPLLRAFRAVKGEDVDMDYATYLCDTVRRVMIDEKYSADEYMLAQSVFGDLSTARTAGFDQLTYLAGEHKLDVPLKPIVGQAPPNLKLLNTVDEEQLRAYWLSGGQNAQA